MSLAFNRTRLCVQTHVDKSENDMIMDESTNSKTSGYASVNGLQMYYELYGEGKPLVLLHGTFGTVDSWGNLLPTLAQNRKVIALEMQGHGRTADSDRPISHEAFGDDVAKLLDHLNIDRADVIGYSLGGTVALQLGIKRPDLVSKLVILSAVYKHEGWLPEVRQAFNFISPQGLANTPLKTEYDRLAPDPKHWSSFVKKFAEFNTQDFNLGEENIQELQPPVLFILGDNDGISMAHKANMYHLCGGDVFGDMARLPASQLAILPGTTHVSLMQQPDRLLPLINNFLDAVLQPAQLL